MSADTELTRDNSDRTKLRLRLERSVADMRGGRIAAVEISRRARDTARKGGAVIVGKSDVPVMIDFLLYPNGRLLVTQAKATDYFGGQLDWRRRDDHGKTTDISEEFQRDVDAAMRDLKLGEVAKMPRPLRWLYLLRN